MARGKFLSALLTTLFVALFADALAMTAPAAADTPAIDPQPVGVVVLVDESGSLTDAGVAAERAAAETIVQADPSTGSQLAVVGFAGRNGGAGQSPVDVVCQPTTVSVRPNSDYLARCTQNLASLHGLLAESLLTRGAPVAVGTEGARRGFEEPALLFVGVDHEDPGTRLHEPSEYHARPPVRAAPGPAGDAVPAADPRLRAGNDPG